MIRKRLRTLGLMPKDARAIALDFDRMVKAMGIVNALEYFKAVGDTLIGFISRSGYKGPWVATNKGYPTKWLALKKYPEEVQLRIAKLARVITLPNPTPKMVSKLKTAATSPYGGKDGAVKEISRLVSLGRSQYNFSTPEFNWEYSSVCSSARTYVSRSVPTGTSVGLDYESVLGAFASWQSFIVPLPNWEGALYPIHPSWVGRNVKTVDPHPHCGELGGVMEQGGKLRIFAAPNVLLQAYLEPLQLWLDKFRDQVPSDVYKDQESGAIWAQDQMLLGKRVQSIDLSSATCRFPFEVQTQLCKDLGAPEAIMSLYIAMARSPWKVQPHLVEWFGEYVKWSVGQPLGVNPSMSSFALCHNLLLAGLCVDLGLDVRNSFRVLGDDVVTSNEALAIRYRQVITDAGILISEHKCYDSKSYAEFAGYSIRPSLMVRPGRWRPPSVLNIQGLVSDLGESVIDELPNDAQFMERLIAFHDGSYSPPQNMWGSWLCLNTLVFSTNFDNITSVRFRQREISWYDGCTKHLMSQFPGIYFLSENDGNFHDGIAAKYPEAFRPALQLLQPIWFSDVCQISTVIMTTEGFAKDVYDYRKLVQFITDLQQRYEGYLWSIPKTAGRVIRDRRTLVEVNYQKVMAQV